MTIPLLNHVVTTYKICHLSRNGRTGMSTWLLYY